MKFCIYSGTFNPIHTAHLIIAEIARNDLNVDKMIFIPAHNPPHRNIDIAPATHRMNMLKLAVEDNVNFVVSDIEYRRDGKSYTYLTIKEIKDLYRIKNEKIYFIIGTDALKHLDSWYQAEKLVKMVKFVVIPRESDFNANEFFKQIKLKDIDFIIAKVPYTDISSSYIRNRIKQGKSIKYLVPDKVEKYIYDHNIFIKK